MNRHPTSGFFPGAFLLLSIFVTETSAQSCCVSLSEITQQNLLLLAINAQSMPNMSCTKPLYWTACAQSSCLLVDCTGQVGDFAGNVHAGFCGPNTTAETAVAVLKQMHATGTCSQRPGLYSSDPEYEKTVPTQTTPVPTASKTGGGPRAAPNHRDLLSIYTVSLAALFVLKRELRQ